MAPDVFVVEKRVPPRHCDAQGMVHAARYHGYCEDAFVAWLDEIDAPYSMLHANGVDLVISVVRYAHRRPARLDERLSVALEVTAADESTLRAHFEIRRENEVLTTAEIEYVAVGGRERRSLPAVVRAAVRRVPKPEMLLEALHRAQAAMYTEGDSTALEELLHPDVVWEVPGHNQIAGTYRGVAEVLAYMRRRRELSHATFRMHRREVLVGPFRFAALTDGTMERDGITHTWSTVGLYRASNGRIAECALVPLDPSVFDAAWR